MQFCSKQKCAMLLALVFLLGFAGNMFAQSTTATITGTVTDASGAVIGDANVQVKNVGTGVTNNTTSDSAGRFTIPSLIIGSYEVTATKMGFQTVVRSGITLTVNQQAVVDVSLPVGSAQQSVTVEGQVSQVETASSTVANLVEQKQMTDLPLNGRNFQQLITLAPGVNVAQNSTNGFYGKGETYSVAGSRPEGQSFLLDGTDVQNFFNRGAGSASLGTSLGMDAIAEFQTLTNTYSAQFPGNGAVVNAATKSGTNTYHGSLYEYLRNDNFDARSFFDPLKQPEFRRNQFGGALGGAIKKDKLFFFGNYEGLRQSQGVTRFPVVPTDSERAQALASPLPIVRSIINLYPVSDVRGGRNATQVGNELGTENYYLARVDYNISEKDSFFGRFVYDKGQFTNPFPNANSNILGFPTVEPTRNFYYTMEEKHIISPTVINVLRGSFVRTESFATAPNVNQALRWYPTISNQDGVIAFAGNAVNGLGPTALAPYDLIQNKFAWSDDVFMTKGAHSIKFGIGFNRIQTFENQPFNAAGTYTFANFAGFLAGTPTRYAGAFPAGTPGPVGVTAAADGYRAFREILIMPYVNDDWKVSSRLTVNLGIRWDFDTNPKSAINNLMVVTNPPFGGVANASRGAQPTTLVPNVWRKNPARGNFNPRFGFAYDPFNDHKTSIRGGFGIFHNTIMARTWSSGFVTGPPFPSASVDATANTNVGFPNPFVGNTTPLFSNGQGVDYNTSTSPYQMQWNINIQREIFSNTVLTVGYVGSRGVHLLTQSDQNAPRAQFINGRWQFIDAAGRDLPRWAPEYNFLNNLQANGRSRYNSLQVNAVRRFANNFSAQLSYTWSKSMDDGSGSSGLETGGGPRSNPYDYKYEYGPSTFDITHATRVNGIYRIPLKGNMLVEGWQINGIMSITTPPPVTVITGFDRARVNGSSATGSFQRPNLISGTADTIRVADISNVKGSSRFFSSTGLALQDAGTFGNLGRNVVRGVGVFTADVSVIKDTKLPKISETFAVQFRAEAFNLLNHTNFAQPNGSVFLNAATRNPNFGLINAVNPGIPGRQIQFALRLNF